MSIKSAQSQGAAGGGDVQQEKYETDCEQLSGQEQREKDGSGSSDPYYSEMDIEKLGRARPDVFNNAWSEIAFCFSIVMSQVLSEYFISGFNVIIPTLVKEFDIPDAMAVWPASAFSLVIASVLLFFGRLGDMIGGFPVYVGGMAWLGIWSLIAGFSKNRLMLIICRALQGLGPAAYLPTSLMLLANVYRPGPRKNLVFSIYGTCAVIGFFAGIFFSGLSAQYLNWSWYFWIGAILVAITTTTSYIFIPSDSEQRRKQRVKMDYWGAALIVPGLVLIVFAITDSAHAANGWKTPYICVCFILGWLFLGAAFYVEGWVAEHPLLPFDLFAVPHMKSLVIALLFFYGSFGVFLLYGTLYMVHIMGASPMQVVAWCTPMVVGGFIFPMAVGIFLHLISGNILLGISALVWMGSGLLFALMPEGASYWAFVFPAMICATMGIDIIFNITNIFITTKQPSERQGLAGALINSVLHLSIAFFLGFGDIAQVETEHLGRKQSYQVAFWYQVGCSVVAFLIMVLRVRVTRAKSELTVDELRQLEQQQQQQQQSS
ncbi:Major Facilitator Superfamily protein [Coccidioides posadasii C735 delta SOWgp]|uniref:Major Facilitator Superfamily protein n=1 Tax=Coccidioides posadasii (strain C735) TaxID=222929 RepID=C5PD13_COCP7|nr:Major Facilitator Superfamily protein [Coccidioides posadasii C735 delta SOWgp]EER24974.1 Major Facilitator Superfamily protein [Coccidioides posadasii C735 delta SOWgp]|eukprot:XP_003067119.1 Major Facilitator Superfamily protein [Coccidioides posadasii C735 delta SOWgp]